MPYRRRHRVAAQTYGSAELSAPLGATISGASFRRSGPDVVDHVSVDADSAHARLRAEFQFMEDLGGPGWSQTYVQPFYMKMPSGAPERVDEVAALLPRLRTLALGLTSDDVASMLRMQWRIQVVAAWLAIARCDPWLSGPVHQGFDHCYGHLTSPSLTVAALVYPNERTAEVLTQYRDRAIASDWEAAGGVVDVALQRLSGGSSDEPPTRAQQWLEILLARARQLQALAD
jgi:hypothetical protein